MNNTHFIELSCKPEHLQQVDNAHDKIVPCWYSSGSFLNSIWHQRCMKIYVSQVDTLREALRNSLVCLVPVACTWPISLLSAFVSINLSSQENKWSAKTCLSVGLSSRIESYERMGWSWRAWLNPAGLNIGRKKGFVGSACKAWRTVPELRWFNVAIMFLLTEHSFLKSLYIQQMKLASFIIFLKANVWRSSFGWVRKWDKNLKTHLLIVKWVIVDFLLMHNLPRNMLFATWNN